MSMKSRIWSHRGIPVASVTWEAKVGGQLSEGVHNAAILHLKLRSEREREGGLEE